MTTEEYKKARSELQFNLNDWLNKLGISKDTHKGYNCGRDNVGTSVAKHIESLYEIKALKEQLAELKSA